MLSLSSKFFIGQIFDGIFILIDFIDNGFERLNPAAVIVNEVFEIIEQVSLIANYKEFIPISLRSSGLCLSIKIRRF